MNYFKTAGGILILAAVIGLETLFSAGVWYMISVGMVPALGPVGADILAAIVAPVVGIMALILFVYSHRLVQLILEWEAENGKYYNEDHRVYYNKPSYKNIVTLMKWVVLLMDTGGIIFRVLQESIPWYGMALLAFVFEMLAISPWGIGILVHIISHRPAYAIRRDVEYMREVYGAQRELQEMRDSQKRDRRPPTAPREQIAPADRTVVALPDPRKRAEPEPRRTVAPDDTVPFVPVAEEKSGGATASPLPTSSAHSQNGYQ